METVNINPVNTLNIRNVYTVHNKEPVYTHKTFAFPTEQQAEGQTNKSADISFSVEKDLNVIITVVKDTNTKKIYILDADIVRRQPNKIIDDVIELHKYRHYSRFGFESNQFQEVVAKELQRRAYDAGCSLNVKEIQHKTDKQARIEALQPLIKNGQILLSKRHRELIEQIKYFPKARHDDAVDALEMVIKMCQTSEVTLTIIS